MHYGIDLSSNNPHPIDYAAAVAALRQMGNGAQPFVIVKATQGSWYVNPDFAADVAGFKAAGAAVGAYLMDEGNADVATEEAFYRRVAGPIPQYDDDELPMGNSDYVAHCAALVAQNPAASDYLNQTEEDEGFPPGAGIWEANYNNQPGVTHRPGVLIHQYSDAGRVAGIQGDVDLNVFLGTETQFAEMFAYVTRLDPPPPLPEDDMAIAEIWHDGTNQFIVWANGTKLRVPDPASGSALEASPAFVYRQVPTELLDALPTA